MTKIKSKEKCFSLLLCLLLSPLLFEGCNVDDTRDDCCKSVCLSYRYISENDDEFSSKIVQLRHFLFDEEGYFLREVPQNSYLPQKIWLSGLSEGCYTMVTLANTTAVGSTLTNLSTNSQLSDFKLTVSRSFDDEYLGHADKLYWSTRSFEVVENKKSSYICDLSNLTCHLFLKVRWESRPPFSGDYTYHLSGVPTDYNLDPSKSSLVHIISRDISSNNQLPSAQQVVHTFPASAGDLGQYALTKELFGTTLYGEFLTLRYTDAHIPNLQLFHDGQPVTKVIDLGKAFRLWGWFPDRYPLQIFRIELLIKDDGSIIVNQWINASTNDWVDGGVVSIPQNE